ncbi:MAG: hypothetical protein PVH77_04630 [Phycisphaerales bacterium]|jgi:hypothetical protein
MLNKLLKSLFLVLVFSSLCPATVQVCDKLIYDGNEYSGGYDEFPLEDYWSEERPKPNFLYITNTACWRGYIATWEMRDGALFLKSLGRENLPNGDEIPIPLQNVFPDANGPILADWFSGVFECTRGAEIKENVFISVHKGKIVGIRKATWDQLKNPSDKDLSWSLLLPVNEKAGEIRTKKWRLQSTRWIDGKGMFSRDGPLGSGKSFKLRGIYFPGGKLWTAPVSYHFLLEVPDSVKSPTTITPVEITAKSKNKHINWHNLIVSNIKVLPVGTAIQRATDNINVTIKYIIIVVLIGLVLAMLGIGIIGRKEGVSFWKFWFTGSYTYWNMHGYLRAGLVKPFLIVNWLSVTFFITFIVYLYFFG